MTYSMSCSNYERILQKTGMILKNHHIEKECGTIYIAKNLSNKTNPVER